MSSSNLSSPTSAASPPFLAPAASTTANKLLLPRSITSQTPPILTHKEWVIPPRPKPGRKPAADTPPTKRKAQNRQAQRAFRERRAARVGELEDLMKRMEEEDASEQSELRARIQSLESELDSYRQTLLLWQQRMEDLKAEGQREKTLRKIAQAELMLLSDRPKQVTDAVPLPARSVRQQRQPVTGDAFDNAQSLDQHKDIPLGCGKCSQDTRCECIEQAFRIDDIDTNNRNALGKRPHSPPSDQDIKRIRSTASEEPQANEIDFTARFSSKKPPNLITSASSASIPLPENPDPCGFCKDGSACICAEMALESMKAENRTSSANDFKAITSSTPSNPCSNGPGTCDQCLVDANSTLFCKSLAATRRGYPQNQIHSTPFPQPQPTDEDELPPTPSSSDHEVSSFEPNKIKQHRQEIPGVALTCADAYETLSRHPAFEKASKELSTWMPQLATVPGGRERTAFEVEAASIMGVLKFFDRRFGAKAEKD
ncbi:MAG: hypothetical protein LQ337_000443 [Flavoplaca oasis]|nr:MAG: hypothetical protein LQ337_000443 [Flavoplaca oasis]